MVLVSVCCAVEGVVTVLVGGACKGWRGALVVGVAVGVATEGCWDEREEGGVEEGEGVEMETAVVMGTWTTLAAGCVKLFPVFPCSAVSEKEAVSLVRTIPDFVANSGLANCCS